MLMIIWYSFMTSYFHQNFYQRYYFSLKLKICVIRNEVDNDLNRSVTLTREIVFDIASDNATNNHGRGNEVLQ